MENDFSGGASMRQLIDASPRGHVLAEAVSPLMTVAMALAETTHHTAPRRQKTANPESDFFIGSERGESGTLLHEGLEELSPRGSCAAVGSAVGGSAFL